MKTSSKAPIFINFTSASGFCFHVTSFDYRHGRLVEFSNFTSDGSLWHETFVINALNVVYQ